MSLLILLIMAVNPYTIFDFNNTSNLQRWTIVDDVVMGGRSSGSFNITPEGHGAFSGTVSTANNGGFSSLRYSDKRIDVNGYSKVVIKLRGDGKQYQFRVKSNSSDYYSYIISFATTAEWQEIVIPLKDMYPSFRGRKLTIPNFSNDHIEEIAFLIGNKKDESFKLLIDRIELR
ncbi:MAG: NADH dehydrogenase [ubiquinone] 1 alpha subcomplex assembly factor 1 [Marinoscillum sp.]|jgi:NADH dehydrogenase [ubiquinone] 1 alpha subcomplex assembly factor 1